MVNRGGLSRGGLNDFSGRREVYYGFEEANLPRWEKVEFSRDGTHTHSGGYAGYATNALSNTYHARAAPFGGDERDASSFSFYIYENTASWGGGIRVTDKFEGILCGWATDNPEWYIQSDNGTQKVYDGDGLDRWIYVEFTFDWDNTSFDYYIEDTQSGTTKTGTKPLLRAGGLAYVRVEDYSAGWRDGTSIDMWVDDMVVVIEKSGFTRGSSGSGVDNLTTNTISNDFETGDLSKWTDYSAGELDVVTDRVFDGSYAGKSTDSAAPGNPQATRDYGRPYKPESVSWYYQEVENHRGAGIRLYNEADQPVVGMATDNPQWIVYDANGDNKVDTGGTYDMWVYVEITFDWDNGQYDIFIERQDTGYSYSGTSRPLNNPSGIRYLYLENYQSADGGWRAGESIHMWWDEITTLFW